jgi:hypothetical protein
MMESPMTRNCHVGFGERYEETRQSRDWKVRFVPTLFSPLLANIALHGMEERIKEYAETLDMKDYRGKQVGKRDRNKGKKWLKSKYFQSESIYNNKENTFSNNDWIFATTKDGVINDRLRFHKDTKITRHEIVRGESSPFDGDLVY